MENCVLVKPWKVLEFLVEKKCTNPEKKQRNFHAKVKNCNQLKVLANPGLS